MAASKEYMDENKIEYDETFYDPNNFSIFIELREIFPELDEEFIKKICDDHLLANIQSYDKEKFLHDMVNYLLNLEKPENHLQTNNQSKLSRKNDQIPNINNNPQTNLINVNQKLGEIKPVVNCELENLSIWEDVIDVPQQLKQEYINLVEMFPNADPELLLNILEENSEDSQKLQREIEKQLIPGRYKTRTEYYSKIKPDALVIKKKMCINDFLKKYEDPFTCFGNFKKNCVFSEKALDFLRKRFNFLEESNIRSTYACLEYNLTNTDNYLSGDLKIPLIDFETEDEDLMDEIYFIQNKNQIRQHLDEVEALRIQNLLITCECCFNESKSTDCTNCNNLHVFCNDCIRKATELAMSDGKVIVKCLSDCEAVFTINVLEKALPQEMYKIFFKKYQEAELTAAKVDGFEKCPNCDSVQLLKAEDQTFMCKNRVCMKTTCRKCKRSYHLPVKCEDVLNDESGRILIQEEMSKALIRHCYKCNRPFIKLDGCNKMKCVCGAATCYICRKPSQGNDHSRCRLIRDSNEYDRRLVEQRSMSVKSQVEREFPEVNIDNI